MKKFIVLSSLMLGVSAGAYAADIVLPPSVGGLQSPQSQMQLIEQQRFRQEEYDEFKDMKQQKEAKNQKLNLEESFKEQQTQSPQYTPDVNLIEKNGQLILSPVTAE